MHSSRTSVEAELNLLRGDGDRQAAAFTRLAQKSAELAAQQRRRLDFGHRLSPR
jgi:hypothetical protein